MDNDRHRSIEIPVEVTVESDLESVVLCAGKYVKQPNGFSLEFEFGDGRYTYTRSGGVSVFSSFGILNYTVDFSSPRDVEVDSVYGKLKFFCEPETDEATETDDGVKIRLGYTLSGNGENTRRSVKIEARFKKEE